MSQASEDSRARERRSSQEAAVKDARHDAFWRKSFGGRPYTDEERGYEYYRPAYQLGWESRARHGNRDFEEVEAQLKEAWDPERTRLQWDEARPAVRDAYTRGNETHRSTPGTPLV